MSAVAGIGGVFTAMGKLIISGISTLTGFLLLTKVTKFSEKISSPLLPVAVTCLN